MNDPFSKALNAMTDSAAVDEANAPPAGGSGGDVMDSTDWDFPRDVLDESMKRPVIVDFWAPWCGPCKQLGPLLARTVTAAAGAVRLVKIDIDRNPEIAGQLRVQSIPAVFAFYQGRPVDGFMGALPESKIGEFIAKLVALAGGAAPGDGVADLLAQAEERAEAGDGPGAAALYDRILQDAPDHTQAVAGRAMLHLAAQETEAARALLAALPAEADGDADVGAARAALELADGAGGGDDGTLESLRDAVAAAPDDLQARYDLAAAEAGSGRHEEAIDNLLAIIAANRNWNEEAARHKLLQIFEALGPQNPLTTGGRRRLSSLLFT